MHNLQSAQGVSSIHGRLRLLVMLQMQAYGQCVTSKLPAVELGICEKEFRALKNCMERAVSVILCGCFHIYIYMFFLVSISSHSSLSVSVSGSLFVDFLQWYREFSTVIFCQGIELSNAQAEVVTCTG
jgi:hypothetical protein